MGKSLKVKLTPKNNPTALEVSGDGNVVAQDPKLQDIIWRLSGNAATGHFVSFDWITPPPNGIFDPNPTLGGQTLVLHDWNNGAASTGMWVYRLKAKVGDKTYATISTIGKAPEQLAATGGWQIDSTTNPTIKNK